MAFIGTPLDTRNTFQSLQGKRFSGDGSETEFTLDVAPSSTLDIEVFVGNVRQDPNSAYTVSGTTLTFTGAPPSGTNNIYVVHQAKSVGTINPGANSVGVTELNLSDGSNGQFIKTDGSGTLSFATVDTSSATDSFTINGSTPTLTIGDAGAEDTKIVFDGNAQDYHIGLDDSTDDLVIGLGSTLGTTTHMAFDENGHITKPLQSAFHAYNGSSQSNLAGDSAHTININTEVFDQNGDFNTSNYTFTAPVTGRYLFAYQLTLNYVDNATSFIYAHLDTSNREYYSWYDANVELSSDSTYVSFPITVVADMDANDTALMKVFIGSGGGIEDTAGATNTWFTGCLLA
jgi:hypothetical protein